MILLYFTCSVTRLTGSMYINIYQHACVLLKTKRLKRFVNKDLYENSILVVLLPCFAIFVALIKIFIQPK